VTIKVSIAEAKSDFAKLLKYAREEPVIITRRGNPDAVQRLRRLKAHLSMVQLSRELEQTGVTVTELYEDSRRELEGRPW